MKTIADLWRRKEAALFRELSVFYSGKPHSHVIVVSRLRQNTWNWHYYPQRNTSTNSTTSCAAQLVVRWWNSFSSLPDGSSNLVSDHLIHGAELTLKCSRVEVEFSAQPTNSWCLTRFILTDLCSSSRHEIYFLLYSIVWSKFFVNLYENTYGFVIVNWKSICIFRLHSLLNSHWIADWSEISKKQPNLTDFLRVVFDSRCLFLQ